MTEKKTKKERPDYSVMPQGRFRPAQPYGSILLQSTAKQPHSVRIGCFTGVSEE